MNHLLACVLDPADATVGGGSAAALAGAMAAGLAGMVARLSTGRECGLSDVRYAEILAEAEALSRDLAAGADEDTDAYGLVAAAYRMPREGEVAAAAREAAIQDALVAAATIPLRNARRSLRVRELCAELDGRSNRAAASDLGVGALLADACVRGCLLNVGVNTIALPDPRSASTLDAEAEAVRLSLEVLAMPAKEET